MRLQLIHHQLGTIQILPLEEIGMRCSEYVEGHIANNHLIKLVAEGQRRCLFRNIHYENDASLIGTRHIDIVEGTPIQ